MAGPLDLHDLAQALLDDVAEALDTIPDHDAALDGAPDRQFVSPGLPVNDFVSSDCCSQIAVWVTPMTEMGTEPGGLDAGRRAARYAWINSVTLQAALYRCIPTGTSGVAGLYSPPSAEELTAAARQLNADGWALWNHLHNLVRAEHLVSLCDEVFFDSITAAIPSGGCAGWLVTIRAALEGYEETLGS